MDRTATAYLILAVLVLAIGAAAAYLRHNTHDRRYSRRLRRENLAYEARMAELPGDER